MFREDIFSFKRIPHEGTNIFNMPKFSNTHDHDHSLIPLPASSILAPTYPCVPINVIDHLTLLGAYVDSDIVDDMTKPDS